jgi:hypothetical protein
MGRQLEGKERLLGSTTPVGEKWLRQVHVIGAEVTEVAMIAGVDMAIVLDEVLG